MGKDVNQINIWENKTLQDLEGEIWKPVVSYEGVYEVSNFGRVKSLARTVEINSSDNRKYSLKYHDKILTIRVNNNGYLFVSFTHKQKHCLKQVHRLVALSFIPNPDNKRCVNHKNSIRTDANLGNLEWVTDKENVEHAIIYGERDTASINSHNTILTQEKLQEVIDLLWTENYSFTQIAKLVGLKRGHIRKINDYNTWTKEAKEYVLRVKGKIESKIIQPGTAVLRKNKLNDIFHYLYRTDIPFAEISKKLNVGIGTIYSINSFGAYKNIMQKKILQEIDYIPPYIRRKMFNNCKFKDNEQRHE